MMLKNIGLFNAITGLPLIGIEWIIDLVLPSERGKYISYPYDSTNVSIMDSKTEQD